MITSSESVAPHKTTPVPVPAHAAREEDITPHKTVPVLVPAYAARDSAEDAISHTTPLVPVKIHAV